MNLEQLAEDWIRAGRRRGNAPGTEMAYQWAMNHFLRLEAERGIERADQITANEIEAYQDWLLESGKSPQSQRIGSSALREFLKWAASKRLVAPELWLAVSPVKVPRGVPKPLPEEDLKKLLLYLLPVPPRISVTHARDRAIFLYLLGTSSRVSEALQVTTRDFEKAWVIQKGGGSQMLLSPPIVVEAVKLYLELRGPSTSEFLWITHDTNRPTRRLTAEGVRRIFNHLAQVTGTRHFSPHVLRHTAASLMLDAGVPVAGIAGHLGHADLSTVMNYAKMSPKRRQEALDGLQGFLEDTITDAQPKGKAKLAEPEPVVAMAAPIQPVHTDDPRGYLEFLTKELEGELALANQLTERLAALLTGPAPSEAAGRLRIVEGLASETERQPANDYALCSASDFFRSPHDPSRRTVDVYRDDPAAIELRAVFSPTHGIAFELFGDHVGIRQGFQELALLVTSNPDFPGWLEASV